MLYLLYGSDEKKAREKLSVLVSHLRTKKPDADYVRITEEEYTLPMVLEYSTRQGLFEKKCIIVLDRILQNKETSREIMDHLEKITFSENIFIFFEESLDKKILERIKSCGGKVQEFENTRATRTAPPPLVFSIADAFGKRDKKQAWALYREALHKGVSPEEIHGTLTWQTKSMLLSIDARTAEKAGLSPFVYRKSKMYAEKYGKEKLKEMSREFLVVYHDMRRGLVDMETVLELQILNI